MPFRKRKEEQVKWLADNIASYGSKKFAYPYPEKKCYLKSILEEDKVNQEENDVRPMKPKVII